MQNHCNGEYLEEVITMFDYDFPSEYYWLWEPFLDFVSESPFLNVDMVLAADDSLVATV